MRNITVLLQKAIRKVVVCIHLICNTFFPTLKKTCNIKYLYMMTHWGPKIWDQSKNASVLHLFYYNGNCNKWSALIWSAYI